MAKRTPYDKYLALLEKAAHVLKLDPVYYERLKVPERLVRGAIRIEMDDGSYQEFPCFRCQHNHARGPTQGGTRFDLAVCESEVKFLAATMSMKNTIVDIRHGGGKGGVKVDKFKLSMAERERLCRGYIRVIAPYIGPRVDGPAPDVNTGGQEMAWFLDEYERMIGKHAPAQFTGKPIVLGGSLGRDNATALGAVYASEEMIKYLNLSGSQTISIQGFGKAGDPYARLMSERGHRIISVSDKSGVIADRRGLSYKDLHAFTTDEKGAKIDNLALYQKRETNIDPLEVSMSADIFVPAAFEDLIDENIARKLKCKFIVEIANGPCTEPADVILSERGIPIVPDIYSSGGGVRVSASEKIQGLENHKWEKERVDLWLESRMRAAFKDLLDVQKEFGLKTLREAGIVFAVRKIVEAMKWRGGLSYNYGEIIDVPTVTVKKDLKEGFYTVSEDIEVNRDIGIVRGDESSFIF